MSGIVDADFERIAAVLSLQPETAEYAFAYAFWSKLRVAGVEGGRTACAESRAEEALVCRVLLWRALTELGGAALFEMRVRGAASGTSVAHPALESLAKLYERLARSVTALEGSGGKPGHAARLGLPDLMKPILEETEVVFDELLGPGGFPGRPPANGLSRGEDPKE